ncbi:hypothetical protein D3C76_1642160 [compost metagenome]
MGNQVEDGLGQGGFAGAGFAHHADGFAGAQFDPRAGEGDEGVVAEPAAPTRAFPGVLHA